MIPKNPLGNLISGPGDGLSDSVNAHILSPQGVPKMPAALSEGEYVLPADVVSHIGNGSTHAGAKVLDKVVKQVRLHRASMGAKHPKNFNNILKKP